jgi:Ca-activated chloride channel homolog
MSLPTLRITTRMAREPLPVTGDPQVAFLLVEVRTTEALTHAEPLPLNLALVVDRSGSMRGPRLQYTKDALMAVVDRLKPEDVLTVIAFDDAVQTIIPATLATDANGLRARIATLEPGGGTALGLGLGIGYAESRTFAGSERLSRMVVISDGPSDDTETCLSLAQEIGAARMPIMPVGLGADWDDMLLAGISARTSGDPPEYVRVPSDMRMALLRQIAGARSVVAPALELNLRFVSGVTPRRVTQVSPFMRVQDASIQDAAVALQLGDLEHDAPQAVLIEVQIAPRRGGAFRIAQAQARSTAGRIPAEAEANIVVTFSASAAKRPQMQPVVLHYVERVNAARIVLHALAEPPTAPLTLAPTVLALFDPEAREQVEALRASRALTPEGRKILLARLHALTRVRRKVPQ